MMFSMKKTRFFDTLAAAVVLFALAAWSPAAWTQQTGQALLTLGTFFRRWDGMVEVLDGMELAEEDRAKAMQLTADYVAEWNKAIEAARASGDRQSMREKANSLKDKLDADMAKVLSGEQMAKWSAATDKR